jgi:HAD superfamily hydrolase (TIGR01509 family)
MIKAILFDMDGTLIDDEKLTISSKVIEGKKYGFNVKREDVLKSLGMSKENSKKHFISIYGENFPVDELAKQRFLYILKDMQEYGIRLKPYVMKIINFCKKNGIKMIICTSTTSEKIEEYKKYGDLFTYFDGIVTGDQIKNGKPHPDIFLKGLELAGVEKEETLIIEDSNIGVEAGLNSGIEVVMIPDLVRPQGKTLINRVKVYKNLNEVISLISEINGY